MKTLLLIILFISTASIGFGQDPDLNSKKGYRLKKGTSDQVIYSDQNNAPNLSDWRKLNYRVYFRKVNVPTQEVNGVTYQMITIPGSSVELDQDEKADKRAGNYPLCGKSISSKDYDQNFWLDVDLNRLISEKNEELKDSLNHSQDFDHLDDFNPSKDTVDFIVDDLFKIEIF